MKWPFWVNISLRDLTRFEFQGHFALVEWAHRTATMAIVGWCAGAVTLGDVSHIATQGASRAAHWNYYHYIYIYIYKMDCVCQRCHKECSTRTCAGDYYYCWKSPNSKHLYDHGFMDVINTPIVRQSKNLLNAQTSDYGPYFVEAAIL